MKLKLDNIHVSVGDTSTVSGVSLSVSSGDVALIMGPNGSGKSSLLSALMKHPRFQITTGNMFLDDEDVTMLPANEKATRGIFFSLQNLPAISGVSLSKLIIESARSLGREVSSPLAFRKEVAARAKEFGFPEELLLRTVHEKLSGGEKKQMEVIQLLALRPKIAILDEIDSGVDVDGQRKIAHVIASLRSEGTGFLIVSHHGAFAKLLHPNKAYLLNDGKIVREGDAKLIDEITEKGFEE